MAGNSLTMWDACEGKARWVHAGHMNEINQFDVHPFEPQSIVSCDINNEIHVFQPTKNARV